MSADNFIAIVKKGRSYIGYHCSASVAAETPGWEKCCSCTGTKVFRVGTIEEAVRECEHFGYLEYGYSFLNEHDLEEPEEGFCEVCAHNPLLPEEGSEEAKQLGCICKKVGYGIVSDSDCPVHYNSRWKVKIGWE